MRVKLEHIRVHEAMRQGIFSCGRDAPLSEVAGIMAAHRVHAVAIADDPRSAPAAVVSDLDLVTAMAADPESTAAQVATTPPVSVSAEDRLDRAAQLMAQHRVSHLVVTDGFDGHPVGILSTLDLAAVYAHGVRG